MSDREGPGLYRLNCFSFPIEEGSLESACYFRPFLRDVYLLSGIDLHIKQLALVIQSVFLRPYTDTIFPCIEIHSFRPVFRGGKKKGLDAYAVQFLVAYNQVSLSDDG